MNLLSISNIAFTDPLFNYPMSYIELFGVIFNALCVWLIAKKNIHTWWIGIVGAVLFVSMFYQCALYSDAILNIYFVVTGFIGWWMWNKETTSDNVPVVWSSKKEIGLWAGVFVVATILWGTFMTKANAIFPSIFTQPAAFPYIDGGILVASFIAQWLMAKRRIECWVYWIAIDVVAIYVYWMKDLKFTSILYVSFLVMATYGLVNWLKNRNN